MSISSLFLIGGLLLSLFLNSTELMNEFLMSHLVVLEKKSIFSGNYADDELKKLL